MPGSRPVSPDAVPVLILNYDGWKDVFETLGRIVGYVPTIWLIDNGSTVDRLDEVRRAYPNVRTIATGANLGWAGGYNVALDLALAEGRRYVYLLNNDAYPHPGSLESALSVIAEATDIAAVASVILYGDGETVFYDGDYVVRRRMNRRDVDPGARAVRIVNGAGVLLNLEAIASVGKFYEEYFLYHEETDWSVLARREGWRLLVSGSSFVTHKISSSDTNHNGAYYGPRNRFLAVRRGTADWRRCTTIFGAIVNIVDNLERVRGAARLAVAEALIDGLRGRFGKRGGGYPRPLLRAVVGAGGATILARKAARRAGALLGR